tara:strand:- start:1751 stop:1951 length:201 start_codon:yes stop_codon:yes gene_type:complete
MKNLFYVPLKKRSISCRATCIHQETGNKFYAWGYGRSKKSALADVKRNYASAKAPYKYTNLLKEAA